MHRPDTLAPVGTFSAPSWAQRLRDGAIHLFDAPRRWHERWQQRRTLLQMDDHLLRDIGITCEDVAREVAKPFWQA